MSEQKIKSGSGKGFAKTVYARLPPGSDLIQGIREVCETEGINNGVIVCCIGSLEKAIFEYKTVAMDPNLAAGGPLVSDGPRERPFLPGDGLQERIGRRAVRSSARMRSGQQRQGDGAAFFR